MLTKNGKMTYGRAPYYATNYMVVRSYDGTLRSSSAKPITIIPYQRVLVGTGTTIPTVDNYEMNALNSSLTCTGITSSQPAYNGYDDNFVDSCTTTYKNSTGSPITITELGLIYGTNSAVSSLDYDTSDLINNYKDQIYMIAHELITPVTIEPGETYAFTMVIG